MKEFNNISQANPSLRVQSDTNSSLDLNPPEHEGDPPHALGIPHALVLMDPPAGFP